MRWISMRTLPIAAATAAAVLFLGLAASAAAATPPPPYTTVAHIQNLILASELASSEGITNVQCVGLHQPKPKRDTAGEWLFHRFSCAVSGSYVTDTQLTVVFTGQGTFRWGPG